MPRLTQALPRMRTHKRSGQAVVYLDGQEIYLGGKKGSRIAKENFDRVVAEWLQRGRTLPTQTREVTVGEIALAYLRYCKKYYVKNGKPTTEVGRIKNIISLMKPLYAHLPASDFGPLALQVVIDKMVEVGWSRKYVNDQKQRVVRMFKWACSREMLPGSLVQSLREVDGLKKGRTEAKEHPPVKPVADEVIENTLPFLPPVVADMVRLQRLLGCRPGEVCIIRPLDIDRTADPWVYSPESHKCELHDKERRVHIGPKAQQLLGPYLLRPNDMYCFVPRESEKKRRSLVERTTPRNQGNRAGYSSQRREGNKPREFNKRYSTKSFCRAVHRACKKAGLPRWSPNKLRHTCATEIRKKFDLEHASKVLGHSNLRITEIYAEADAELGRKVARQTG